MEALEFDPHAEPAFEALKGCLVWPDERPEGISSDGYEKLCELWAARGLIHLGSTIDQLPNAYREAWQRAIDESLRWPGFRRIELSDEQRAYLEAELRELANSEDGI